MTVPANVAAPFGLRPINDNGTPWSGQGRMVSFPAAQTGNIFLGDPIVPLGGSDAYGVPSFGIATAGATNIVGGGFVGIGNGPAAGGNAAFTVTRDLPVYRQASILNYGFVCDDPNQLYAIQDDGSAIVSASQVNQNANLAAGSGGSTVTGYSSWALVASTIATTNTFQLRILGLLRGPGVNFGATFATWVVRINLPSLWAILGQ